MSYQCLNCGKGNWKSTRSQHHKGVAGGIWKHKAQKSVKLFKANLHSLRVVIGGTIKRVKLCTDCISQLKKSGQLLVGGQVLKKLAASKANVDVPVKK